MFASTMVSGLCFLFHSIDTFHCNFEILYMWYNGQPSRNLSIPLVNDLHMARGIYKLCPHTVHSIEISSVRCIKALTGLLSGLKQTPSLLDKIVFLYDPPRMLG